MSFEGSRLDLRAFVMLFIYLFWAHAVYGYFQCKFKEKDHNR